MSTDTVDWGATRKALRNREEKAAKLARAAWNQGLDSDDIPTLDPSAQRKLARVAGVNASKPDSPTWTTVVALLVRMEQYAQRHPDHEAVVRAEPDQRTTLLPIVYPKGWAELVQLGPVPGRTCGIGKCQRPAVVRAPNGGRDTWRCAKHPPVGSDWGADLNWKPTGCNWPIRCYCGRCTFGEPRIPEPRKEPQ